MTLNYFKLSPASSFSNFFLASDTLLRNSEEPILSELWSFDAVGLLSSSRNGLVDEYCTLKTLLWLLLEYVDEPFVEEPFVVVDDA